MPLMLQWICRWRLRSRMSSRLNCVRDETLSGTILGFHASGIDQRTNLASGRRALRSVYLPHLLVRRVQDFLAQRVEQTNQFMRWLPAGHGLLQLR